MKLLIIAFIIFNFISCNTCKPCEKKVEVVEHIEKVKDSFPICENLMYDNKELTEESFNLFFPKIDIDMKNIGSVVKKVNGVNKVFYIVDEDILFDLMTSNDSARLTSIQLLKERKMRCDMILEFNK